MSENWVSVVRFTGNPLRAKLLKTWLHHAGYTDVSVVTEERWMYDAQHAKPESFSWVRGNGEAEHTGRIPRR